MTEVAIHLHIRVCLSTVVKPWSEAEKAAVTQQLGYLIQLRRPPKKIDCLNAIAAAPILEHRDWRAVKGQIASKIRYAHLRDRQQ